MNLTESDKFHIRAAQGWLELGNHLEANEELENITPAGALASGGVIPAVRNLFKSRKMGVRG